MTSSADSIVHPLTAPDVRARMVHSLPARVQVAEGDALAHRALAQLTILLRNNEALRRCEVSSIYSCVIAAVGLNLEINTPLQQCFLVPFANECKLVMGYRGLIELARRGSKIKALTAEAVYEGDHFYAGLGTENRIEHRPALNVTLHPLIAAYSVAFYDPLNYQFVVMRRYEIDKVRKVSRGSDKPGSAWVNWFDEMAKKCPVKRLCKLLPQDTDALAIAIDHDDRYEIGKPQAIPHVPLPDGVDLLPDGTPRSDATLSQKMQAGAAEQTVSREEALRIEIPKIIERIPVEKRGAVVKAVLESVGAVQLSALLATGDLKTLADAADRLEVDLPKPSTAIKDSPAQDLRGPAPPQDDDDIAF